MPDHLHAALARESDRAVLVTGLRAFARWRNARRGEAGPVFEHGAEATPVRGRDHERRTLRYLYLNPCRKGLASDPLAWPFSSYRDLLGLAVPALGRRVSDPTRLHAFVSGDPSVRPEGTELPDAAADGRDLSLPARRAYRHLR